MSWLLIAVTAWVAAAVPLALLIGRSIRHADAVESVQSSSVVPDFLPADWAVPATGSR
jgi:hypothetical protein